eukprot:jgi/Mesvir1/18062/Mv09373-RA.1
MMLPSHTALRGDHHMFVRPIHMSAVTLREKQDAIARLHLAGAMPQDHAEQTHGMPPLPKPVEHTDVPRTKENAPAVPDVTILVVAMSPTFGPPGAPPGDCPWGNTVIKCGFVDGRGGNLPPHFDAYWYNIANWGNRPPIRDKPLGVFNIAFSLESAAYYPALDDFRFMRLFDIEQSYRVTSHTVEPFVSNHPALDWFRLGDAKTKEGVFSRPMPLSEKVNAVVFENRNCYARSGREALVRRMMEAGVTVHAIGSCLHNHEKPADLGDDKIGAFHRYRFCVAMENSNMPDYVTEKLFDALRAGCLPLYMGAPNVDMFMPYNSSRMFLNRASFPSDDAFIDEIKRLSKDDDAYNEYFKWKQDAWDGVPFHAPFRRFLEDYARGTATCNLCNMIATIKYGDPVMITEHQNKMRRDGSEKLLPLAIRDDKGSIRWP